MNFLEINEIKNIPLFSFKGIWQHNWTRSDSGIHQRDVHHETVWTGESLVELTVWCFTLFFLHLTLIFLLLPVLQLFLPSLLRFTTGLLGCGDLASRNCCLEVLVSLILAKAPPPTDGSMAFETYPLLFTGQTTGSDTARWTRYFISCLIFSFIIEFECNVFVYQQSF